MYCDNVGDKVDRYADIVSPTPQKSTAHARKELRMTTITIGLGHTTAHMVWHGAWSGTVHQLMAWRRSTVRTS